MHARSIGSRKKIDFFIENTVGGQWNFSISGFDFALVCKILLRCSFGSSTCGRRLARAEGEAELGYRSRTALASLIGSSIAGTALRS